MYIVVVVVQSIHYIMLYLASMGPTTLSTTMQMEVVVQFLHHEMLYLPLMEPIPSSITQQLLVVQFIQISRSHWESGELVTTLHNWVVVQSTWITMLFFPWIKSTTSLAIQNLPSGIDIKSTTLSTTQQTMVVHSAHHTMLYLASLESTISSTTQQYILVVQSAHHHMLYIHSLEPTTSLAIQ